MDATNHYSKAPIIEAVIDFKARFGSEPALSNFQELLSLLADTFPKKEEINFVSMGVSANTDSKISVQSDQGFLGFKLTNKTFDRIVQLRKDGFTYSHLAPYTKWDVFLTEAKSLWAIFASSLGVSEVTRTAVRYINRIEIPESAVEPEDYFNFYPKTPSEWKDKSITKFAMQVEMPQVDIDAMAQISQAVIPTNKPNSISIVFDIDIFNETTFNVDTKNYWEVLEKLRNRKNDIFECCITDRTRELIK